jgi:hypothetical protein
MIQIRIALLFAFSVCSAAGILAAPPVQRGSNATLASMEQLRQMETSGKYQEVVRGIAVILHAGDAALSSYDLYDLQMLRAEAQVQMRSSDEAAYAFTAAAAQTRDDDKGAMARAMAELVKKSPRMVYRHTVSTTALGSATPQTFDITQTGEDQRTAALSALLDDEWTAAQPGEKAAIASTQSITPIFDFVPTGGRLHDIELAATHKTDRTDKLFADLVTHAQSMIDPVIDAMKTKVDAIQKYADKVVNVTRMWEQIHNEAEATRSDGPNGPVVQRVKHYRLQGFNGGDAQTLQDIVDQCQTVNAGLTKLMKSFGKPADALSKEATDAALISTRAKKMLERDYAKTVTNPKDFNLSDGQ